MRAIHFYALFMHDKHWDLCAILAGVENLEQKRRVSEHLYGVTWEAYTGSNVLFKMQSSTVEILDH